MSESSPKDKSIVKKKRKLHNWEGVVVEKKRKLGSKPVATKATAQLTDEIENLRSFLDRYPGDK